MPRLDLVSLQHLFLQTNRMSGAACCWLNQLAVLLGGVAAELLDIVFSCDIIGREDDSMYPIDVFD